MRDQRLNGAEPLSVERAAADDGGVVLRLRGELTAACAKQFEAELAFLSSANGGVIDLSGLTFIDSSGIRMLLEAESLSRRSGWQLAFVAAKGQVQQALETTGILAALSIVEKRPNGDLPPRSAQALS